MRLALVRIVPRDKAAVERGLAGDRRSAFDTNVLLEKEHTGRTFFAKEVLPASSLLRSNLVLCHVRTFGFFSPRVINLNMLRRFEQLSYFL